MTTEMNERLLEPCTLTLDDYDTVAEVQLRCFPTMDPWSKEAFISQVERFPEGQIGVTCEGELAATSTSLSVRSLDLFTQDDPSTFCELAVRHNVTIIGGTPDDRR